MSQAVLKGLFVHIRRRGVGAATVGAAAGLLAMLEGSETAWTIVWDSRFPERAETLNQDIVGVADGTSTGTGPLLELLEAGLTASPSGWRPRPAHSGPKGPRWLQPRGPHGKLPLAQAPLLWL